MGKHERQAYLKAIRTRYRRARKKVKVTILDEFCCVCRYNRKYAIRLLNQRAKTNKRRRSGPKPTYASAELLTALKRIWFASDQMCSKKLKAAIPLWLPFYETVYKVLSLETQEKLLTISAATIDVSAAVTSGSSPVSKTQLLFRRYLLIWMIMQLLQHQHCCQTAELRRRRACSAEGINPTIALTCCSQFGSRVALFAWPSELAQNRAVKEQNPIISIQMYEVSWWIN